MSERPSGTILKAGVMGWPIGHSLSPRLHGYWLRAYNIAGTYEALAVEPEKLANELRALTQRGFRGVNLTIPHKEAALTVMDSIDPAARRIGAVNMVVIDADGKLEGRNTDAYGFTQNLLAHGIDVAGKPVTVLGAGGAARAAIAALQTMGAATIRLVNRTQKRAEALRASLGGGIEIFAWGHAQKAMSGSRLLVNTTSLGMKGQPPLDLPLDALPPDAVVNDLVYAPLETGLLKAARASGHKTVDGLGMLLHQARPAFKAFFGRDPEVTDALRAFVLEGK